MRERKYVRFRVDMYDGTKFKIIDMKPERDLIHYIWTRIVTLAGKINLEGNLYMSKNIPYTIETLAIEFNRGFDVVKLALDVLIELEMLELTEDNIYSVKNFAKHQNIKIKEKIKYEDNDKKIKNEKVQIKEVFKNEITDKNGKKSENIIIQSEEEKINKEEGNLEIINKDINKIDDNSQGNIPILLDSKKNTRPSKKQNKKPSKMNKNDILTEDGDEKTEDNRLGWFSDSDDGEIPLEKDDRVVGEWSF